ncbi:MAG: hypothetical protein OEY69_01280 [Candidatus Krumholzibacteria bacterium]|nr:hypothetical protein [Candidatus Krumholzibacteria bacterium]
MRRKILQTILLLALGGVFALGGCLPTGGVVICITDDCQVVAPKTADGNIHIKRGSMIEWCNESHGTVVIRVSHHKLLSGSATIRLAPGERVSRKIGRLPAGPYEWKFFCLETGEGKEEGGPGPPVVVEPEP